MTFAERFVPAPFRMVGILNSIEHKPAVGDSAAKTRVVVNTAFGFVGEDCSPEVYEKAAELKRRGKSLVEVDVVPEHMKQRSQYEKGYAYRLVVTGIREFVEDPNPRNADAPRKPAPAGV